MKLALITARYAPATIPCGVGDYTRCLRAAFEVMGHPCAVLTSAGSLSAEGNVYRLAGRWGPQDSRAAIRILRKWAPEALFLQYTPEHYGFGVTFKLLPFLARRALPHTRIVTSFHTLVGGRWISRPYAALLAAGSHGIISTNTELSDLFRRRLPWFAHKLCEIPIGANIPTPALPLEVSRRRLRQRLGLGEGTPVLVTFGFPAPGKGYDTLIRAVAQLDAPPGVHLACFGETRPEDESYRAGLDRLAVECGVTTRVHWVGGLPGQEAADLLAGGDAYVVPYDEGASLRRGTLLAGFRVKAPIITTTPRYPDPALRDGETVLAVSPCSAEALVAGLQRLLEDHEFQERLRRGQAELGQRFDWTSIAFRHLEFVARLSTGSAGPS